MAQIVKMPDGKKVSFPDDMPKEEIRALIEEKFPNEVAAKADLKAAMKIKFGEIAKGAAANQAPVIQAAVSGLEAGGGLSPEEEASGQWERGVLAPIAKNTETGERKLAVPGAVMGAYDAFKLPGDVMSGEVDMDPAKPVSDEAIERGVGFTTVFSPGAPKTAPKAPLPGNSLAILPKESKALIPTAADLKKVATAAYDQAKGSQIAADVTPNIVGGLRSVLEKEGLVRPDGKLASTFSMVRTAMKDAEAYNGKPMTFEQFQRLEEALQGIAGSKTPGEARIGKMLLDKLDEQFASLPETAFTKGSAAAVKAGYAGGKAGWAQYKKLSMVEKAVADAELAKGGFTEGLRAQFRTILKSDRKSLGLSDEEKLMMRQFVMGGKLDKVTSWLTGLRGMLAGGVAGGVVGALATAGGGAALKAIGSGVGKKTANQLRASIASGAADGPKVGNTLSRPSSAAIAGPLVRSSLRASGPYADAEAERGGILRDIRQFRLEAAQQ